MLYVLIPAFCFLVVPFVRPTLNSHQTAARVTITASDYEERSSLHRDSVKHQKSTQASRLTTHSRKRHLDQAVQTPRRHHMYVRRDLHTRTNQKFTNTSLARQATDGPPLHIHPVLRLYYRERKTFPLTRKRTSTALRFRLSSCIFGGQILLAPNLFFCSFHGFGRYTWAEVTNTR